MIGEVTPEQTASRRGQIGRRPDRTQSATARDRIAAAESAAKAAASAETATTQASRALAQVTAKKGVASRNITSNAWPMVVSAGGGNATAFQTTRVAFAAWGSSLSGKESAFYTAVLDYMTAVGAA